MVLEIPIRGSNAIVVVDVVVDQSRKIIHVFDMRNGPTVTQWIDCINVDIIKLAKLQGSVPDWRWILYHTDNTISEFSENSFDFNISQEDLYQPFVDRLVSMGNI